MGIFNQLPELLPVIVLVPDAWHTPVHYSTFIDTLATLGYPIACPQLPTGEDSASGFNEDCSMVYQLVFDLSSDGNDVVVLGHGYGAFVATEVLGNLGKAEREQMDKTGGVIGIVALAGLLPDQGQTFKDILTAMSEGEWPGYIRPQKDTSFITLIQPGDFLYSDLGPMDREHWASHLVQFTANPSNILCDSIPAWKSIPTTCIIFEDDQFLPETLQRAIAEKTGANIIELEDAGHDGFIAKSEDLVEIIGEIVTGFYLVKGEGNGPEDGEEGDKGTDVDSTKSAPEEKSPDDGEEPVKQLRRTTTAPYVDALTLVETIQYYCSLLTTHAS